MARGGARPGAGRPAGKSANTSPPSRRARARARDGGENQRPWPADKVERWSIDRLIPYAKNARTHSDARFAAMGANIRTRPSAFEEALDIVRGLLAGETVSSARRFRIAEASLALRPAEPVEVWIGASAPPAIDRAARLWSGWPRYAWRWPEYPDRSWRARSQRCRREDLQCWSFRTSNLRKKSCRTTTRNCARSTCRRVPPAARRRWRGRHHRRT
jgi:hypothetical protein